MKHINLWTVITFCIFFLSITTQGQSNTTVIPTTPSWEQWWFSFLGKNITLGECGMDLFIRANFWHLLTTIKSNGSTTSRCGNSTRWYFHSQWQQIFRSRNRIFTNTSWRTNPSKYTAHFNITLFLWY